MNAWIPLGDAGFEVGPLSLDAVDRVFGEVGQAIADKFDDLFDLDPHAAARFSALVAAGEAPQILAFSEDLVREKAGYREQLGFLLSLAMRFMDAVLEEAILDHAVRATASQLPIGTAVRAVAASLELTHPPLTIDGFVRTLVAHAVRRLEFIRTPSEGCA